MTVGRHHVAEAAGMQCCIGSRIRCSKQLRCLFGPPWLLLWVVLLWLVSPDDDHVFVAVIRCRPACVSFLTAGDLTQLMLPLLAKTRAAAAGNGEAKCSHKEFKTMGLL